MNVSTQPISHALVGNGLLGHAINGTFRIPALLACATTACMVGELCIRGIAKILSMAGLEAKKDNWIEKMAKRVDGFGIRPYKDDSNRKLAANLFLLFMLGNGANEFVRLTCGRSPEIYNQVLSLIGPIRLNSDPYLVNANRAIRYFGSLIGL